MINIRITLLLHGLTLDLLCLFTAFVDREVTITEARTLMAHLRSETNIVENIRLTWEKRQYEET